MKRAMLPIAATVLIGLVAAPPSRADFELRVPYVSVRVGQPTVIRVPFVTITLPGRLVCRRVVSRTSMPAPPPARVLPAPAATLPGEPPPVSTQSVPARPVPSVPSDVPPPPTAAAPVLTVKEFAASFKPQPEGGQYEAVLKHPYTGKPVKVSFTLPPGTPRRIMTSKPRLEFRYPRGRPVVVRFYRDGSVRGPG
jgi:hypothetical protein